MVQHDANVATGVCMAAVSPSGQRTFFSFRGANVQLEPPVLPASEDRAVLLHLCGHGLMDDPQRSSALAAAELALSMHTLVSLDLCVPTARSRADIVLSMVPRLALLFMNEAELGFLLPGLTWEHALQSLLERGARLVVLKRGGDGCVIATPRATLAIEALPVTVADTNGCGDAFVAGFLWAYIQGASLPGCGAVGNMLGACTATRLGAADALPTLAELGALLEAHPAWSGTPIARDVLVRTLRQRAV
jgi:ribokinase